ncbi:hypothetical protein [Streptomyces chrestomyceticus]|uniref:hypothetical protein n=1 Tax=Streptomyces chrestomyceticus TaxID=68185 RepID=UPI0037A7A41B
MITDKNGIRFEMWEIGTEEEVERKVNSWYPGHEWGSEDHAEQVNHAIARRRWLKDNIQL